MTHDNDNETDDGIEFEFSSASLARTFLSVAREDIPLRITFLETDWSTDRSDMTLDTFEGDVTPTTPESTTGTITDADTDQETAGLDWEAEADMARDVAEHAEMYDALADKPETETETETDTETDTETITETGREIFERDAGARPDRELGRVEATSPEHEVLTAMVDAGYPMTVGEAFQALNGTHLSREDVQRATDRLYDRLLVERDRVSTDSARGWMYAYRATSFGERSIRLMGEFETGTFASHDPDRGFNTNPGSGYHEVLWLIDQLDDGSGVLQRDLSELVTSIKPNSVSPMLTELRQAGTVEWRFTKVNTGPRNNQPMRVMLFRLSELGTEWVSNLGPFSEAPTDTDTDTGTDDAVVDPDYNARGIRNAVMRLLSGEEDPETGAEAETAIPVDIGEEETTTYEGRDRAATAWERASDRDRYAAIRELAKQNNCE